MPACLDLRGRQTRYRRYQLDHRNPTLREARFFPGHRPDQRRIYKSRYLAQAAEHHRKPPDHTIKPHQAHRRLAGPWMPHQGLGKSHTRGLRRQRLVILPPLTRNQEVLAHRPLPIYRKVLQTDDQ